MTADEEQLALIAGHPVNINDYPPLKVQLHKRAVEAMRMEGMLPPAVYPGSIEARCQGCQIRIAIGPRQQAKLVELADAGVHTMILCLLCAVVEFQRHDGASEDVVTLGNPDDPNFDR